MSKLRHLFLIATIIAAPLVGMVTASAESCTITNTGPGSTNECISADDYICEVDNNNTVTIFDKNNQTVVSGSGTITGNTGGGGATTGTVSNANGTSYNVVIENGTCAVTAVTPAPVVPQGGGGKTQLVTPDAKVQPTVLATTSGPEAIKFAVGALLGTTLGVVLLRYLYRMYLHRG